MRRNALRLLRPTRCAVAALPGAEVFLAVLLGKLIKYGVLSALAARFPAKFRAFIDAIDGAERKPVQRGGV